MVIFKGGTSLSKGWKIIDRFSEDIDLYVRVLKAEIDKLVVTARRKGKEWWIAGMSAGPARTIELPLTFLTPTARPATLWLDDLTPAVDPNTR